MKNKTSLLVLGLFLCGTFLTACSPSTVDASPIDDSQEAIQTPSDGGGSPQAKEAVVSNLAQLQAASADGVQDIAGWLGYVVSPAEGGDDKLVWMPEGTGAVGLVGATPELEAQIVALRNAEQPGKYAHFWGKLADGVEDFNNSQLVVTRIRAGASATNPEPIHDWEGLLNESVFNGGQSHVLTLQGMYPMQFSVDSNDPAIKERIIALSGTPSIVRVSGDLITGVPDINGSRIQVTTLEAIGDAPQGISNHTTSVDQTEGWNTYHNSRYGYQFRYPDTATITTFGVMGVPTEEIPDGMDFEEYKTQLEDLYGDQICVQVQYALGVIYFIAPLEDGGKYTMCGSAGLGVGQLVEKSELLTIDDTQYTIEGFELIGPDETLSGHNEMYTRVFENGIRIGYGSAPHQDATFEDYQMKGHDMIRRIIETLNFTG